jgi:hypothetical protein
MASVNSATWTWPAEVLEFARASGIEPCLSPLLEVTRRAFPGMKDLRVTRAKDHDPPFGSFLAWEVTIPEADADTYRAQTSTWYREYPDAVPSAKRHLVSLFVIPVKE